MHTLTGASTSTQSDTPLWEPGSWRARVARQQPDWDDPDALDAVVTDLSARPGLVRTADVDTLHRALAVAAEGRATVLQAGNCAERFTDCTEPAVRATVRVIRRTAALLGGSSALPVVTVGRIAGQFGKPRSAPTETVDGRTLPVFRGDSVNGTEPMTASRRADPDRLRRGYDHASDVLRVLDDLAATASDGSSGAGSRVFASHEALLLPFEEALTRRGPREGRWFDLSAHQLWIGERTRAPDEAHVEFLSGVANPVGVKVGPNSQVDDVLRVCEQLDPHNRPGRLTLISRMGAGLVLERLMPLVAAVASERRTPLWLCDPMHGNTTRSANGHKTRRLDDILAEIEGFLLVHRLSGTHPGGLHLELTGGDVTECTGGGVVEADLPDRYETACDPRLNGTQSVELARRVAAMQRSRP